MYILPQACKSLFLGNLHDLSAATCHKSVELALKTVLQELQRLVAHHLDLADDALVELVLPLEGLDRVQVLVLAGLAQLGARADNYRLLQ